MSPALRVALSIAAIWEAKKPAWFSSSGGQQLHRDVLRQQRFQDGLLVRLVVVDEAAVPARGFDLGRDQLLDAWGSGSPPT